MVFGRLIRSIGLGKAQATEEKESDTTSASAEYSIKPDAAAVSSSHSDLKDEFDQATDTGDEDASESSEPSAWSGEVFSKTMLLQFRAATNEPGAGKISQSLPTAKECSKPTLQLERSISSTKSTPKSSDSPNPRLDVLTPTAGSWVAAMQSKRSVVSDEDLDDEKVTRKACSILNKLTVEKFDSLFEQLATCGIKKPVHLEMLMREVFNKATTQHHFIAMYADLCVRLEQDGRIKCVAEEAGQQHSFRRLLLNQCQMSFEQLLQPDDMPQTAKDCDMDEEYALKRKQQALGNIKLIGQLLVHGIVTSKLLVECSEELLRCRDSCPEALESLAALLSVAGKQFDTKTWQYHPRLLEVFNCMRKLSKDKSTQARTRFLLRDVLDVRDAGWSHCTYKATLATAPMKLEEVRESAANEGKYMSLEDQIETDTLLAGLMKVSQMANAKSEKLREDSHVGESTPMHSKSGRHKSARQQSSFSKDFGNSDAAADSDLSPSKQTAAGQRRTPKEKNKTSKDGSPRVAFDLVSFRRALAQILADLASDRNVPAAVRRMRLQEVPYEFQAKEFADILTRIVEERRGPIRRCALAFATGLAAAEQSAFQRTACLDGIGTFFNEVYPTLCDEIPRLPAIVNSELLPTLRNVFPKGELNVRLPEGLGS